MSPVKNLRTAPAVSAGRSGNQWAQSVTLPPKTSVANSDGQVFGVAALRALLWGLLLLFAVDHTGLLRTDLQSGSFRTAIFFASSIDWRF
jgi:hypothetical protein